jgi:hypothetical protein
LKQYLIQSEFDHSELKAGNLLQIDNDYFWKQQVVYNGIEVNKLSLLIKKTLLYRQSAFGFATLKNVAVDADIAKIEF